MSASNMPDLIASDVAAVGVLKAHYLFVTLSVRTDSLMDTIHYVFGFASLSGANLFSFFPQRERILNIERICNLLRRVSNDEMAVFHP